MKKLRDAAHYVSEKIDVSSLKTEEYITTNNIIPNRGGVVDCESLPKANRVTRYEPGDILISNIRPYFKKIWYSDRISGCSNDVIVFRTNDENWNKKFLYYVLSQDSFFDFMMAGSNGTKMPRGDKKTIPEFLIPDFDINEQIRISDILSAYDGLIENNQKQIKLLEEAAQRLYKERFVDLHFPGYEDVKIVDGLPEGWIYTTVDSFIKLQSGYAFKSNSFDNKGKFKIVTIKNVQDGKFDGNNVNRIVEIPAKMPSHCKLIEGDALLSLTGNVGRICTVIGSDYLLNQRVAKIESDYPCYAYYLFSSKKMFHDMNNLANGAAQQNLSPIRTGQMQILKPSKDILLRFEEMTKPLIDKKILLNKSMITTTEARDRLLPKLMSGEIEV